MTPTPATTIHSFEAIRIDGTALPMSSLTGKVLLIVNTASQCGFTPQMEGLQSLHRQYADQGLVVMGFPCNQFGHQDPGSNEEIASFCTTRYGVDFMMMAKVEVNGAGAHPLWAWLKAQAPGVLGTEGIKWNFTKFLVGRDGRVIRRFAPNDSPKTIEADVKAALAQSA